MKHNAKRRKLLLSLVACVPISGMASLAMASGAQAHDGGDTNIFGIVDRGDTFAPTGAYDDPFNGFKVFLSSPRHADSGNRGECMNPGRQENVNGRQFGWRAGNGNFYDGAKQPTWSIRNLHGRGYKVFLSRNSKDNGYLLNRDKSRNWGSTVHIITHTNAAGGCDSNASYLLAIWNQDNDRRLARKLGSILNENVPGSYQNWQSTGLAELSTNATRGDAYIELQFHDNQATQSWLYDKAHKQAAYMYGLALDDRFGYPG